MGRYEFELSPKDIGSDGLRRIGKPKPRAKRCPFCAETIRYEAIKCRFCGEFLYGDKAHSQRVPERELEDEEEPRLDAYGEPADEDQQQVDDDGLLYAGRPSVFALTTFILWSAGVIALCWGILTYPIVDIVLTRFPQWSFSESHLALVDHALYCGAWGGIGLVVIVVGLRIVFLKSIYYEVTPDRIEWSRGIFDRRVDNIDMFRVIDLKLRRSLFDCIVGIGTVHLTTKDESDPDFQFVKVRGCRQLYDAVKKAGLDADRRHNVVHLE